MNQEPRSTSFGTTIFTFLAGAAAGAAVMALTTPKTGPQLRGDLKDLGRRAKLKAGAIAEDAADACESMRDKAAMAG